MTAWDKEKQNKITLVDDLGGWNLFSIELKGNGVTFCEEYEGDSERNTTIQEAKQILLDALAFIESFDQLTFTPVGEVTEEELKRVIHIHYDTFKNKNIKPPNVGSKHSFRETDEQGVFSYFTLKVTAINNGVVEMSEEDEND